MVEEGVKRRLRWSLLDKVGLAKGVRTHSYNNYIRGLPGTVLEPEQGEQAKQDFCTEGIPMLVEEGVLLESLPRMSIQE